MEVTLYGDVYGGRRILLTGHTGFKGSWFSLWLQMLGARITGLALSPETSTNHWDSLGLTIPEFRLDIRDAEAVENVVKEVKPEIVFHLAGQSLVRRSYQAPLDTFSTNILGTANLLEACRQVESVRAIVVITTDKCYENREWVWGYRESDPLGGHDAYSASKAGTEMVCASYRCSFFRQPGAPLLATARAGNVIGGGDWSEDRLIPDLVRAVSLGDPLRIRSPQSTRPWQHVLECLSGYLLLGQRLLENKREYAEAWNFGPDQRDNRTVANVLEQLRIHWPALQWRRAEQDEVHEARLLHLDSAKARQKLGWYPVWSLEQALKATADWYRQFLESGEIITQDQLEAYVRASIGAPRGGTGR
ncbi:MAG: CDP-glucose 4,6-dehydratase [Pseudomonadota bacterium]